MLYDAGIIRRVAATFRAHRIRNLVVDPVIIASSGACLLRADAVVALCRRLLPLAAVVTPNLMEAETLAQRRIASLDDLCDAARALADRHGVPFLVKGGHLRGSKRAVDVLCDGRRLHEFSAPVIPRIRTHGTGCTYSAAIAAHLALGCALVEAVAHAKIFVTRAIRDAIRIGRFDVLKI
jgi:hydroxymethylpyrimidine/phosphomethylpyrimidine kinase